MAGGAGLRRTGSSCSTSHRCRSPVTDTAATNSQTPGSCPTTPNGRDRGEPAAGKPARRVRRAAWGIGPRTTPAPPPRPTRPGGGLAMTEAPPVLSPRRRSSNRSCGHRRCSRRLNRRSCRLTGAVVGGRPYLAGWSTSHSLPDGRPARPPPIWRGTPQRQPVRWDRSWRRSSTDSPPHTP
jgi:hypothetical protein